MEIEVRNIPEAKRPDLERWAKYTIEKFEFAVARYRAVDSGTLINSFRHSVSGEAGGDNAIISFAFEYYLRMIDMGVGKGVRYDERKEYRQDMRMSGKRARRARPVYNRILWGQMYRLQELLGEYYSKLGIELILYGVEDEILVVSDEL